MDPRDNLMSAPALPPLSNCRRHATWKYDRLRVLHALRDAALAESTIRRFAACGAHCHVFRSDTQPDTYLLRRECCKNRWCKPCQARRAATVRKAVQELIGESETRFITLTLKAAPLPLKQRLSLLYLAYSRLRRSPLWKHHVAGAIAFVEVKLGKGSSEWHPHLHVIVTGSYIPQNQLASAWSLATKGSSIVDIRRCRDAKDAVRYVTAYATKAVPQTLLNDAPRLSEAIAALHGRKLIIATGNLAAAIVRIKPDHPEWKYLGELSQILSKLGDRDDQSANEYWGLLAEWEADRGVSESLTCGPGQVEHSSIPPPDPPEDQWTPWDYPSYDAQKHL